MAGDLARRFDAKLVLLSAFKDSAHPAGGDSIEAQWANSNAARVREILSRAEAGMRREGIDCTTRVKEGDAADVLVELASECGAVSTRARWRRVLGSVPNTVAHKAPCAVLVVKTT